MIGQIAEIVLLVKPFARPFLTLQLILLLILVVIKPKNIFLRMQYFFGYIAFTIYLIWLFADQFLFTPGNLYRFENSVWQPIIEAMFL